MKPKCDVNAKNQSQNWYSGFILPPTVYLNNRLSYGEGQENEAGFIFSEPDL